MCCFLVKISASGILENILVVTINGFFWTLVCFSGSSWYNLLLCRPRFCRYENKPGMIAIHRRKCEHSQTAVWPRARLLSQCNRSRITLFWPRYIAVISQKTHSNRNSSDRRIQSGFVPQGPLQRIRLPTWVGSGRSTSSSPAILFLR